MKKTHELLAYDYQRLLGLLWVSRENSQGFPAFFQALDHLLDGILVKKFRHFKDQGGTPPEFFYRGARVNLFTSPFFNRSLYVAHIAFDEMHIESDLRSLLPLIFSAERGLPTGSGDQGRALTQIPEILILDEVAEGTMVPVVQGLRKEFPQIHFPIMR